MKRKIVRNAFDWLAKTQTAQLYGTKAAKEFAKELRAEARRNDLVCWAPSRPGGATRVIAGDSDFCDWMILCPLEVLIKEAAVLAFDEQEANGLDNMIGVLERSLKKARRLRAKLGDVPDRVHAPGHAATNMQSNQ